MGSGQIRGGDGTRQIRGGFGATFVSLPCCSLSVRLGAEGSSLGDRQMMGEARGCLLPCIVWLLILGLLLLARGCVWLSNTSRLALCSQVSMIGSSTST